MSLMEEEARMLIESGIQFFIVSTPDNRLFKWNPSGNFNRYSQITELITAGDFLEKEFHHLREDEIQIAFSQTNGIYYVLGADFQLHPTDLDILLRQLIKRFQSLYDVEQILSFDHLDPVIFSEYCIIVESEIINYVKNK